MKYPIFVIMKNILLLVSTIFLVNNSYGQSKPITNRKIAIVIGVAEYEFANPLKNTVNDADDISIKLESFGFKVKKLVNPELKTLSLAIDSIFNTINNDDQILIYFSGHGAEFNGENYLFLKNSNPKVPNDMLYETYPLGKLIGKIEYSKIKTSILILDACRSNPFVRSWNKSIYNYEGLANVNAPNGMFVGFAASPGKTASDGSKRNGTYTEAILKNIEAPNLTIDQIFNKVNKDVRSLSAGKQIPFKTSSLEDDYYFRIDSSIVSRNNSEINSPNLSQEIAIVNRPKFPMPKNVKGYVNDKLNSYATAKINKTTFGQEDIIEIYVNLLGSNIWDKTTPLIVEISQRKNPTNIYVQYDEQYQAKGRNTTIRIANPLKPGNYELSVGFYLINELNAEYPSFYSKKFNITIL